MRVRNDTKEVSVAQTSTLNFTLEIREADGTCIHQRYRTPPIIPHATVDTPYHYNLYKRAWVIYANYTCEEGYHLQNNQSRYMFCQSYKWTSPDSPVCVKGINYFLIHKLHTRHVSTLYNLMIVVGMNCIYSDFHIFQSCRYIFSPYTPNFFFDALFQSRSVCVCRGPFCCYISSDQTRA